MFYVTAIDGPRVYFILGPFETHQEALDLVDDARRYACEVDGRAHFMGWGTSRYKGENPEIEAPKSRLGLKIPGEPPIRVS